MGMMNKFSRTQASRPLTHIDGVALDELIGAYGSPLFVFSEKKIVEKVREMRELVALRYPKFRLAWSYKTNYLDAVCKIFHREGSWAEVVSEFEYDKAIHLGVSPEKIHFNGPYKPRPALEKALGQGAMVHLDHFDEMALAEQVARNLGLRPKVALRINLMTDGTPAWSRFGFNLEGGQARDAVRRLQVGDRLDLAGLHCHLGTFIQDPAVYKQAAAKLAAFANSIREDFGISVEFIDLGGGIASRNTLQAQYLPGEQATPPFSRYAEAIADGLSVLDFPPRETPTLVLETGRALVDEAGHLVTTVLANKRLPDQRRALVVDAGVNILFTSFWYDHDLVPAQEFSGIPEPTIIFGPLCMNIDVVRNTLLFPPMKPGNRLVFKNVGAYNVTQWMQFITYRPAVVLVSPAGKHALMRRAENLDSVISHEEVPEWL